MKRRYRKLRFRLHQIMEMAQEGDRASAVFDWVIMALIGLSVVEVILETVADVALAWGPWLWGVELFCSMVFTIEYVARLWACVEDRRYKRGWRGRLSYALSPMAIVDLLAIVPFFLPLVITLDNRTAGALRMLRLMRIFKLARYMESVRLITDVFRAKRRELVTVLVAELLLLVAVASIVYVVENRAQPDAFSSIPAAMWWAAVTMTTVGYGDMTPVTVLGKFLAASVAFIGVAMFALPTAIIASGFAQKAKASQRQLSPTCPHCGNDPFVPPDPLLDVPPPRAAAGGPDADVFSRIIEAGQEPDAADPGATSPPTSAGSPSSMLGN